MSELERVSEKLIGDDLKNESLRKESALPGQILSDLASKIIQSGGDQVNFTMPKPLPEGQFDLKCVVPDSYQITNPTLELDVSFSADGAFCIKQSGSRTDDEVRELLERVLQVVGQAMSEI